jgi:quercetin dioxygenase-like cupin family protein
MPQKSKLVSLALCAGTAAAFVLPPALAQSEGGRQQAVPVYQEPLHRLVFSNRRVRVLDVRVPPGVTTDFHVHAAPLVGVTIVAARTRTQILGSEFGSTDPAQQVGTVFDNWSATLPYTHRVENLDSVPLHYVVAERLESPGGDAMVVPADGMVLVKEGPTARIHRVEIPPRSATALHTHSAPGLTVLGVPGELIEDGDRSVATGGQGAGKWLWRDAGIRHALRNPGDKPLTVFEMDLR